MYNHEPEGYLCPFCSLIRGIEGEHVCSVQSDIVYCDEMVTALIGSHQWPNNHGNVIIVPNKHFENIYDLPVAYASHIHRIARLIALAFKEVYDCDGVSTRQHNEPAGNQDVWHYHLHVTPRYAGDQFYESRREVMPAAERAAHAQRLRDCLAREGQDEIAPCGYDVAFLGHYTRDTIVSAAGVRVVDGGAFNYGAHVAAAMGLRVAAITRLAVADWHVVTELETLGVDVFVNSTPASTYLRLEYPTADVDERTIYVASSADPFTPAEVQHVEARAFVVGASLRGEVSLAVIEALSAKSALLAVDAQIFAHGNA